MSRTAAARDERAKTIDELAYDYEMAKQALAFAKGQLDDAETALVAAVPCELEGSLTTESDFYRIVSTGKLTRTLDAGKLDALRAVIPAAIYDRVIRFKPDLSLRDLRYLELNEPEYYRAFAEAITTKPAKTSVKVERIEIEE